MPHAEYDVYGPRSKATTSRSGSRRFAAEAALRPAASPPMIARRMRATVYPPCCMPELPEVEITARRIDAAVRGDVIESVRTPGINVLKTFDPPLHAIEGRAITGVARRGKHFTIAVEGGLVLLV